MLCITTYFLRIQLSKWVILLSVPTSCPNHNHQNFLNKTPFLSSSFTKCIIPSAVPKKMHHSLIITMLSTTTTTFLLFLTTATATTTSPSDISALKAIKSLINPNSIPSYSCLASWNFTSDPCQNPHITHFLCGLSCSEFRITQLTFDRAGYTGSLSPSISQLTQLITIDLSDNKLSGPIPISLFSLPNLQTLNLRSNLFSGSISPSISNLKSIQTIDISHNSLTMSIPDTFHSLLTLTRLDLSFNGLTGPIPTLPKNIIELAIKSNSLSGDLQKLSYTITENLEVIELSNNSLTGTIPDWFFLQPSLQQVNLAYNKFTNINILKPVDSNLIAVDLGYNNIVGNLSPNFSTYPLLSSLSLSYNKLHGPIPAEFAKVRRLFLDGNYLSGLPPKEFFTAKSMVSGSLGDNCLKMCPISSQLCVKSQKPSSICQKSQGETYVVVGGKVKPKS